MGRLDVAEVFYCMHGLLAITEVLLLRDLGLTREVAVQRVRATQRSKILRAISIPAVEKDDQEESQHIEVTIKELLASGTIVDVTTNSESEDDSPRPVEGELPVEESD